MLIEPFLNSQKGALVLQPHGKCRTRDETSPLRCPATGFFGSRGIGTGTESRVRE